MFVRGCEKFVIALAYLFCLALVGSFLARFVYFLADLCRSSQEQAATTALQPACARSPWNNVPDSHISVPSVFEYKCGHRLNSVIDCRVAQRAALQANNATWNERTNERCTPQNRVLVCHCFRKTENTSKAAKKWRVRRL